MIAIKKQKLLMGITIVLNMKDFQMIKSLHLGERIISKKYVSFPFVQKWYLCFCASHGQTVILHRGATKNL